MTNFKKEKLIKKHLGIETPNWIVQNCIKMLNEFQYLEQQYNNQKEIQLILNLNRNDYVKYVGGSKSKYLTKGKTYRLTGKPNLNRVCIINNCGKRMNAPIRYFISFELPF